jgi:uncharacterized protein (UPF0276 family)
VRWSDASTRPGKRGGSLRIHRRWTRFLFGERVFQQSCRAQIGHPRGKAQPECSARSITCRNDARRVGAHGHRAVECHRNAGGDGRFDHHRKGARQSRSQEVWWNEGRAGRRGELRCRHVLWRYEKEDSVTVHGVGLGLRWEFLDELTEASATGHLPIDFLEVSPENYMRRGGRYPVTLASLADRYPVVTHGLTMSLGGFDPLGDAYLRDLAAFLREMRTPWHSDHLCFGAVDGRVLHDLLPVPFTRATVDRVVERICRAREAIDLPIAIENVSYYWHPGRAEMGEAELLARVCEGADCQLMLDVNNAWVNAQNFGLDLNAWLSAAPLERVVQIHVAGHEWFAVDEHGLGEPTTPNAAGAMIIDTHGAAVGEPVMALLERVLARTGPVPVVLERDQNVPGLDALLTEMQRIRTVWQRCEARSSVRSHDDPTSAQIRE